MTREQALAHGAINAGRYFNSACLDDDSRVVGNPAVGRDIRLVEIVGATANTNTSSSEMTSRDMLGDQAHIADPLVKDFPKSLMLTDSKYNEIPDYARLAVFDGLQKLRADETRFRAVLRELQTLTTIREGAPIVKRLEVLLQDFQDDYGRCLDTESLRTFIALLSLHPNLRRPVITAADNGNLFAEWKSEDGKRFLGLQMLPIRQIRFVAFRPDAKYPQLRNHSSGITPADQLFTDLASYDVLAWARVA